MYFFTALFARHYRFIGAMTLAAISVISNAQQPPPTVAPEVVVTATRFDEAPQTLPVGVTMITAQDIQNSTAKTVPELLSHVAGIQVRNSSGSPNQQVDLRGFGITGDQNTLILLDGQRISENEQASANLEAIPLATIDHIEIMRGSGAVLYGGGATGGTINIITKSPTPHSKSFSVGGETGSFSAESFDAAANLAGENFGLVVSGRHQETDNYRESNALRDDGGQADLSWVSGRNKIYAKFGGDAQELDLPGSLTEAQIKQDPQQAATPGDYSNLYDGHVNLGGNLAVGDGDAALNLGYRSKVNHAAFFTATPFRDDIDTQVNTWSASPRLRYPITSGNIIDTVIAGYDYDKWDYDSTTMLGTFLAGHPLANQEDKAWYLENILNLPTGTKVSVGGRAQRVTYGVTDDVNSAQDATEHDLRAYEVAVSQELGLGFSLYGKFGNSFRVPNVNDNYNLFTATVALLEPQTSHDREVGLEFAAPRSIYKVSLYEMDINHEIHLDPFTFNNVNLPPTRRYGAEFEGKWQLTDAVSMFANYTYAVAKFREGNFGGVDVTGFDVPLVPTNSANFGLSWEVLKGTKVDASARYVGEQSYDGDETNVLGEKMPSYTLVDLKVSQEVVNWLLSAGIKNLMDEKYYSYGVYTGFPTFAAYPEPGRSWFVSAKYTFK